MKWSFPRSDPSLQHSRRGAQGAGGLRRNGKRAEDASPRGRLRGARAPGSSSSGRKNGGGEARRRGAPETGGGPAPGPPPPAPGTLPARRAAVRSVCAGSPRRKSHRLTPESEKSGNFARERLPTLQHAEKEKNVRR